MLGVLPKQLLSRSGAHALVLALVLVASFVARFRDIHASLPYARHPDEEVWAGIALRMLRTGNFEPHRYRKPSLPVYLMSAGFSLGLARAGARGEASSVPERGERVERYYGVPSAAEIPKALYALFSVISLGVLGLLARAATGDPRLLWLAPSLAALSPSYYQHSWTYMNVDTIGTAFVLGTVAWLIVGEARDRARGRALGGVRRAAGAGVLVGLAVGSKYNLFPVAIPAVLWFVLHEPRVWFRRSAVVAAVALACFVLTTPYALVRSDLFLRDVLTEVHHYASGRGALGAGHRPDTVPAGWPMLRMYLSLFGTSFGWPGFLLAFGGVALLARRSFRLALVVFSYPVCFVLYMSMQRVFFERNALAVQLFVALALAVAVVELPAFLARRVARFRGFEARARLTRAVLGVALAAFVALGVPWTATAAAYTGELEPRHAVARWLEAHAGAGTTVVVDQRVGLDPRTLPRGLELVVVDLVKHPATVPELAAHGRPFLLVVPTQDAARSAATLTRGQIVAQFSTSQRRSPGRLAFRELSIVGMAGPGRPADSAGEPSEPAP